VLHRISTPHDGFHTAVFLHMGEDINALMFASYQWPEVLNSREQFQVLYCGKSGLSGNMRKLIADGELVMQALEAAIKPGL
jgi:hypothetical protein